MKNSYLKHLKNIEDFIKIFNEAESVEEFMLLCTLNGKAPFATKKYFDTQIFLFMYTAIISRSMLKYRICLKKEIKKLNDFYNCFK